VGFGVMLANKSGWSESGDGETCSARANNQGACAKTMNFGNLSPLEKSKRASECGTEFACTGEAPQEFSAACPALWNEDVDHSCLAPVDYVGPCVGRKSFVGLTVGQKSVWGRSCMVKWPARLALIDVRKLERAGSSSASCQIDYSSHCPDGWTVIDGHDCMAPSGYEGSCGLAVHKSLTYRQKKAFEDACNAPWPCTRKSKTSK